MDSERARSSYSLPDPPIFSSGTYVVQIPKDQIYRIPPPENALIVERHRNPSVESSQHRRSCCLRFFLPIAALLLVIILLAVLLPPLLSPPKPPIVKLTTFKLAPSGHDFHIKLNIHNPNSVGSMSFKSPSHAFLSFRKHELATAKFPLIHQEHGSEEHVTLAFHVKSSSSFPKEFKRRMEDKKSKLHVAMSLKMNLPTETIGRLSMRRNVEFVVVCSFTVNTLEKNSKILSHDCESKRQ